MKRKKVVYKRLTNEERIVLKKVQKSQGIRSKDIAKSLKISPSYYANKVCGTNGRGLTQPEAEKVYTLLGNPAELEFLKIRDPTELVEIDYKKTRDNKHWNGLYEIHMRRLRRYFQRANSEQRGKVLQGLENLMDDSK